VAFAVEPDVAGDPADVSFLGADGVVPQGDATRCLRRMASRTWSSSFLGFSAIGAPPGIDFGKQTVYTV
jgi:hypothetical protein